MEKVLKGSYWSKEEKNPEARKWLLEMEILRRNVYERIRNFKI